MKFVSIGPEDAPQNGRDDFHFFRQNTLPSFQRSYDYLRERIGNGHHLTVVYRSNMLGAQCAVAGSPAGAVRVVLQPSAVKSIEGPPWPMSRISAGIGRSGRLLTSAIYGYAEWRSPYRKHIRAFRQSIGAPINIPWRQACAQDHAVLMMCPRWFALPQPDWPENIYLAGFPLPKEEPIGADLGGFIARHGAPLVFTPGTGVSDPQSFFQRAAETARLVGMPALFLSRHVAARHRQDPRIFCTDYLALSGVLRQAAAIFHHGGIGTVAEALRTGCPQIVIPDRFDQPDNAMRIARLGLGGAIMSRTLSGESWAEMLRQVLGSRHVQAQLQTAKHLIAMQDSVRNAGLIVQQVASDRRQLRSAGWSARV